MTPHEIFSRIGALHFVPQLQDVDATYRYDIAGAGQWRVLIHHGYVQLAEGAGAADCLLRCDADDFVAIVLGQRNAVTTMMQGRLFYQGPIEHLWRQRFLRPAEQPESEAQEGQGAQP